MKKVVLYTIFTCLSFTLFTTELKSVVNPVSYPPEDPRPLKSRGLPVKAYEVKVLNKINAAHSENNSKDEKEGKARQTQDGINKHGGFFFTMSSMAITIILVIILL